MQRIPLTNGRAFPVREGSTGVPVKRKAEHRSLQLHGSFSCIGKGTTEQSPGKRLT